MASLNKLAIRGIRSFDDKQISVIEFFSPVTVIVGHNGSGKTTIIECLKYATTGDQPPNTRGGAFVHDPKMANEKEVKAQVKLRFHSASGTRMLAVRNLSVTVKKTAGLTMKTLESILALADGNADKGGKRGVISTKCAEMDSEIPHLLGVSKSVLENVIFCHQEDSYWPLAEPAALKKKFDDIFEATRYTKALDSIKSLRKDRVAELKTEKAKLDHLAQEKAHADKLKNRISDLNATIAAKEIEYEETRKLYDELVEKNAKFYDWASKFRELYQKVENLQANEEKLRAYYAEAKENVQEIEGSDDELRDRQQNFGEHVMEQKERRRKEDAKRQDLAGELARIRKAHVDLITEQGRLAAEAKAQELRISEREDLIREISNKHNIKGFDSSPLAREKVVEFSSRLGELVRKQKAEYDKLQAESRSKNDEYSKKALQLRTELEGVKLAKSRLRDQINERQLSISDAESKLNVAQTLPGELRTLLADMEDKTARLEKIKTIFKETNYDRRLQEKTSKAKDLEIKRDQLTAEVTTLSLQADTRAKLDIKRAELKTKSADVKNVLEAHNAKFRKLAGKDAQPDIMERELERVSKDKEDENTRLEGEAAFANRRLNQAETTLSHLKAQAKAKQDELKGLERKVKVALDTGSEKYNTLEDAIQDATEELNIRREMTESLSSGSKVYEDILRLGKAKKKCQACNRHLDDNELVVFERSLKDQLKKLSPEALATNKEEEEEWSKELKRLQSLSPYDASLKRIKGHDLPALEQQIADQEMTIPATTEEAEEAAQKLTELKAELREISTLTQYASHVSRTEKEVRRLTQEISSLEKELSATGSTKTADDVQSELEEVSTDLKTNDREKQNLINDRERQNTAMRSFESDLNEMRIRENNLKNDIRDKTFLEERIETMKKEIVSFTARSKELDSKSTDAQAPIDLLAQDQEQYQKEVNSQVSEAQRLGAELSRSVDKLDGVNKLIERYVKDKGRRQLQQCEEEVLQHEAQIGDLSHNIEDLRTAIAEIDKGINESGASLANLRENLRIRKLAHEIEATKTEINSYDMEEAARARRNFQDKYTGEKEKESQMQSKHSHIGGEISSHKAQLKTWEGDLKEYKDINKRYTDQLVKVKMSDMANSDLEKYAKALDNAIMKYHGLKMEEVNDTMRHLWNKTYQGTDIDGIKIRSDVEGGASKRSYNYRVVMTKDQVEMDMRGRCSAGQKMLASIIIRLALSDSFGQNCGILALDEPTNALDTENIDALAASLVDIINERKNHSNFQLIIITHDENFLRKLGQSDVMEYYWRVSRDSRQKSVIERQRFR